jgi:hypothetical protein
MFILAIPEYVLRSFYYLTGMYILKKNLEKNNLTQIVLLQLLYLLTSFLCYDGSDADSYTFAHLWINPPESFIMSLWGIAAITTIIMLIICLVKNLKQHTTFQVSTLWFVNNITLGCLLIPALTILLILLPSLTHAI